jgi:glycerophosphoryl diester phosphodiesterase
MTAHRGRSMHAPENSLSAIKRAIADGAEFAEIDVQETADGVVALLRDTDLMRVAGVNKKIWEVTYEEIKTLDAGSCLSPPVSSERQRTKAKRFTFGPSMIQLPCHVSLTLAWTIS